MTVQAAIVSRSERSFTVQVEVPYHKDMLKAEELILECVNAVGNESTAEILSQFDTNGSPIMLRAERLTSKGSEPKAYQTPYGEITIDRHVYQSNHGGQTYCPLEVGARIVVTSTPKFAKIVASKYAEFGSARVLVDLEENHSRSVARSYIQNLAEAVAAGITAKEGDWSYDVGEFDRAVKSVSIGLDGTCMLLCEDGFREAMVGTIALYDRHGERLHTTYTAATPEYGKEHFIGRFENEIGLIKARFPKAEYIGLADGAKSNWPFLQKHTDKQVIDFWHATQYLSKAADVMLGGKQNQAAKEDWLEMACHKLKHNYGGASRLLKEMNEYASGQKLSEAKKKDIDSAISYFKNNKSRMRYHEQVAANQPIGSGVTEAACKVIVKQRLCGSGMKWKETGASSVLRLRTMTYTGGRWQQFWSKVSQYGMPIAA